MKVKIAYKAFRLSKETESVLKTEGSVQFMIDHQIPFEVIKVGDNEHLEYAECTSIDVPWYSAHMFKEMAHYYNCSFTINEDDIMIHFKEERDC